MKREPRPSWGGPGLAGALRAPAGGGLTDGLVSPAWCVTVPERDSTGRLGQVLQEAFQPGGQARR